jgi:amino-acid N-acetyltransferase
MFYWTLYKADATVIITKRFYRWSTKMIRSAGPSDMESILGLLAESGLPTGGIADLLDQFVVAEDGDAVIAVGGVEYHGSHALLRSLAVSAEHRGRGVGTVICDHLEALAAQHGVESIYILTETAEEFFAHRGYAIAERSEAPAEIAASEEFADLCPQSATFMRRLI